MANADPNWSQWFSMAERPLLPSANGVYRVRATRAQGEPLPITLPLGTDYEGIVYYGEGQVDQRICRLWWITDENQAAHAYHPLISTWSYYGLERLVCPERLQVSWRECADHVQEESRLLDEYKRQYGVFPVGNLKAGRTAPPAT